MNIHSIYPLAVFCTCAALLTGCVSKPAIDSTAALGTLAETAETSAVSAEDTAEDSMAGTERSSREDNQAAQAMFRSHTEAIDCILTDWESLRSEALCLRLQSSFYYETLYENLGGMVLYMEDSGGSLSDLVIEMTVYRNHVGRLDGGSNERLIYEWHRRDEYEYISVRSNSDTQLLREYMCREASLSVSYLPEFKDMESDDSWNQLFADLSNSEPDIEFIKTRGSRYRIHRDKETCQPMGDGNEELFFLWLQDIRDRSAQAAKKSEITPEAVADALPEGYLLGFLEEGEYYNYEVADINLDGYDDILAEIRPMHPAVSPEERSSNPADSPYRKLDAYYALELWLLEGRQEGGYTPRLLEDTVVWDDTYSFGIGGAFPGGFSIDYFVGRSPFSAYQFHYEYDRDLDCFRRFRSYYTAHSELYMIGSDKNFGQISLPPQPSDTQDTYTSRWEALEEEMETAYPLSYCSFYNIPDFADKAREEAMETLIREDLDGIAAALDTLGQMKSPSLTVEGAFSNTNILVISYKIAGDASAPGLAEAYYERKLYRMYDLNANERIPIKEEISFTELERLGNLAEMPMEDLANQYRHLEDPVYELDVKNNPLALFLTQEGLCMLTCETRDTTLLRYQRTLRLVPREYLLGMELSSRWDDIPAKPAGVTAPALWGE